jgi:PAS domain S-box-containing protein
MNALLSAAAGLFEHSIEAVVLVDPHTGQVCHVNPAFLALGGWPAADPLGQVLARARWWADPDQGERLAGQLASGRPIVQAVAMLNTDAGHSVAVRINAALQGQCAGALQVWHLMALADGEQDRAELSAILETALVGIAFNRSQPVPRHFVHCNPMFEAMFGWPRGELIGQPTSCIWPSREAHGTVLAQVEPALRRGEAIDIECTLMRRDGSTFAGRMRGKMVADGPGRPEGTVMTFEDMTVLKQHDAALAAALQSQTLAHQAKSEFVANVSHEIRNPVHALLGLAQLASDPQTPGPQQQVYLQHIMRSAQALKDLLDNTLDIAKIEARSFSLEVRPFAVAAMLEGLTVMWAAAAQANGLHLACEADAQAPAWVAGDALRIRQVLSNFLSNAVKFSRQSRVLLRYAHGQPGCLRFEVTDQGPGMDPQAQGRLFRRFMQLEGGQRVPGTGLGLAISHELAQLMGGSVGVVSALGQGTTLWLELPLQAALAPRALPKTGDIGAAPQPAHPALHGLRVLVVDDEEVNLLIAQAFVERWGGKVATAADGPTALSMALAAQAGGTPFEVVLMDLHLPGQGGIETTALMRAHPALAGLVVIGLSAAAGQAEAQAALQAGMLKVMGKPFDADVLRDLLRTCRPRPPA